MKLKHIFNMDNTGNKLTQEILKKLGFEKEVIKDRDGDETKWWIKDGISIHEASWWLTELDKDDELLETPISSYAKNETPPEITFAFATYIKSDGGFKGGFSIETDQQLKNLYYSLTNTELNEIKLGANTVLPAVNFTDFCKDANLEQIKRALEFYNEKFVPEKVLEYFLNWTIVYDDSQWRKGKILTNKHSTEDWETTITINDDAEYMFADEDSWQYLPKTFSEFISDVLRYEDFDLLLSEVGRNKIYGRELPVLQQDVVNCSLSDQITGVVCDFCNKTFEVKNVYFLANREDKKTVICERCEDEHQLVF